MMTLLLGVIVHADRPTTRNGNGNVTEQANNARGGESADRPPLRCHNCSSSGNANELNDQMAKESKTEKVRYEDDDRIPQVDIDRAMEIGLRKMHALVHDFEPRLHRMGLFIDETEPSGLLAQFSRPTYTAQVQAKFGYAAVQASLRIKDRIPEGRGRQNPEDVQLLRTTILEDKCPLRGTPRCSLASKRYRTADGTCNNFDQRWKGASMLPLQRFLLPDYEDGVQSVRRSVTGSRLPSAREISIRIHRDKNIEMETVTLMFMQWGQFLDHDVTSTAQARAFNGSIPRCCANGGAGFLPPDFLHPDCLPIPVPDDDWFLGRFGVRCLEFVRSAPSSRINCDLGWREQINQVTAYIDASTVYGSDLEKADSLRTFRHGFLQYGRPRRPNQTPPDPPDGEICHAGAVSTECFNGGDSRYGVQPALTALHTVFLRYHNRLAMILGSLNPHWSDEKLYQEARRIVAALVQHVTYKEFLPILLGHEVLGLFDLHLERKGYYKGYDARINPAPANSFSTAAFRFGHSMVQNSFIRSDSRHRPLFNNVSIHEEQENPENIWSPGSLDRLILGFANQPSQRRDEFISSELTNHLFQTPGKPFGIDLAAVNIQRGRDHGIPSYTAWREPCGLTPVRSWADLETLMSFETIQRFRSVYEHVDDLDLYPAGLAEKPVRGGIIGPTFACIIAQQFSNFRKGDRFWYENGQLESSFTPAQLQQIRQLTFAQILCQVLPEIETIQPFVFLTPDGFRNSRLPCSTPELDGFDLRAWTEKRVENLLDNRLEFEAKEDVVFGPVKPINLVTNQNVQNAIINNKLDLNKPSHEDLQDRIDNSRPVKPSLQIKPFNNKLDFDKPTQHHHNKPVNNKLDFDKPFQHTHQSLDTQNVNSKPISNKLDFNEPQNKPIRIDDLQSKFGSTHESLQNKPQKQKPIDGKLDFASTTPTSQDLLDFEIVFLTSNNGLKRRRPEKQIDVTDIFEERSNSPDNLQDSEAEGSKMILENTEVETSKFESLINSEGDKITDVSKLLKSPISSIGEENTFSSETMNSIRNSTLPPIRKDIETTKRSFVSFKIPKGLDNLLESGNDADKLRSRRSVKTSPTKEFLGHATKVLLSKEVSETMSPRISRNDKAKLNLWPFASRFRNRKNVQKTNSITQSSRINSSIVWTELLRTFDAKRYINIESSTPTNDNSLTAKTIPLKTNDYDSTIDDIFHDLDEQHHKYIIKHSTPNELNQVPNNSDHDIQADKTTDLSSTSDNLSCFDKFNLDVPHRNIDLFIKHPINTETLEQDSNQLDLPKLIKKSLSSTNPMTSLRFLGLESSQIDLSDFKTFDLDITREYMTKKDNELDYRINNYKSRAQSIKERLNDINPLTTHKTLSDSKLHRHSEVTTKLDVHDLHLKSAHSLDSSQNFNPKQQTHKPKTSDRPNSYGLNLLTNNLSKPSHLNLNSLDLQNNITVHKDMNVDELKTNHFNKTIENAKQTKFVDFVRPQTFDKLDLTNKPNNGRITSEQLDLLVDATNESTKLGLLIQTRKQKLPNILTAYDKIEELRQHNVDKTKSHYDWEPSNSHVNTNSNTMLTNDFDNFTTSMKSNSTKHTAYKNYTEVLNQILNQKTLNETQTNQTNDGRIRQDINHERPKRQLNNKRNLQEGNDKTQHNHKSDLLKHMSKNVESTFEINDDKRTFIKHRLNRQNHDSISETPKHRQKRDQNSRPETNDRPTRQDKTKDRRSQQDLETATQANTKQQNLNLNNGQTRHEPNRATETDDRQERQELDDLDSLIDFDDDDDDDDDDLIKDTPDARIKHRKRKRRPNLNKPRTTTRKPTGSEFYNPIRIKISNITSVSLNNQYDNDGFVLHPTLTRPKNRIGAVTKSPDYHININIQYLVSSTQRVKVRRPVIDEVVDEDYDEVGGQFEQVVSRPTTQTYFATTNRPSNSYSPDEDRRPINVWANSNRRPIEVYSNSFPSSTFRPSYFATKKTPVESHTSSYFPIPPSTSYFTNKKPIEDYSNSYNPSSTSRPWSNKKPVEIYSNSYIPSSTTRPSYFITKEPEEERPVSIYPKPSFNTYKPVNTYSNNRPMQVFSSNRPIEIYSKPNDQDLYHYYDRQPTATTKRPYIYKPSDAYLAMFEELQSGRPSHTIPSYLYLQNRVTGADQGDKNFVKISTIFGDDFRAKSSTDDAESKEGEGVDLFEVDGGEKIQVDVIPDESRKTDWLMYNEDSGNYTVMDFALETSKNDSMTNELPKPMKLYWAKQNHSLHADGTE